MPPAAANARPSLPPNARVSPPPRASAAAPRLFSWNIENLAPHLAEEAPLPLAPIIEQLGSSSDHAPLFMKLRV